ncbi:GntR family transcriptional regulator [Microbacterium sp. BWT-B31]|uniref:FadR/GntR family transcriptional regulator n=1 Tax=Microbacterium sp. BWT-B31 TaxID=3232072 RepID=UPI003526E47C
MTEARQREVGRVVYRPVREANALEDTTARIVQTIRLGVVGPGESLPAERELAARYEVSRDTVREAIRELADTGFLVRRRGRGGGTFVADPLPSTPPEDVDPRELDDVLGLRRVLEAGTARAAAGRALDDAARAELWERHEATRTASAADYRRHDTRLHLAIAELSGIPSLVPLVADNRARVNGWLDTFPVLPRNIEHANAQHERLVRAITGGRPDAAVKAILEHLAGSEALLRGFLG